MNSDDFKRATEIASGLFVVVLVAFAFYGTYSKWISDTAVSKSKTIEDQTSFDISKIRGVDASKPTLLFGLSTTCGFCNASTNFYQRLITDNNSFQNSLNLVAVFREDRLFVDNYLSKKGLKLIGIPNFEFDSLGIVGTPTLVLIDSTGHVVKSWVGKLNADVENEVLRAIEDASRNSH